MTDNEKQGRKRSERMLKIFKSAAEAGVSMEKFPVHKFSKYLNGRIISAKRGEIEVEFDVKDEWANPTGLLHGGMQAALQDEIIGMTTVTLGYEGFLLTIDMHVNYLGKVEVGETIRVKASLVREGRKVLHFFSTIRDKDDILIATANANLLRTKHKIDFIEKLTTPSKD